MLRKLVVAWLLIALVGCAAQRQKDFSDALNTWMGHNINEMIRSWGPPSSTYDQPNGDKIYTWQTNTTGAVGMPLYGGGVVVQQTNSWCRKDITANPAGTIIWFKADGNNCY